MKTSTLKKFLIDKVDYDLIRDYNWKVNGRGYFQAKVKGRTQLLHRVVAERMGLDLSYETDHKDRNRENNSRSNLRIATHSQNQMNKGIQSNNKSGYPGVSWYKPLKKWRVRIGIDNKEIALGYFSDKEDAIKARKKAALKHFGEFANAG